MGNVLLPYISIGPKNPYQSGISVTVTDELYL